MKRFAGPVLLSLLILLVLGACSQNAVGIFASIARERLVIDDRDLANDITVGAITRAGSRYFMASGPLRYRDLDDPAELANQNPSQWAVITGPGSDSDNYVTTSVVEFKGAVYATFVHGSGSPSGVYQISAPAAATPVISSSPVFGSADSGVSAVGELFVATDGTDTYLMVSARTDSAGSEYVLYYSADGALFSVVPGTDGVNASGSPWTDVASDSLSANLVYVSAGKALIDAGGIAAGANATVMSNTGKDGAAAFRAAHWDGSAFWLSDDSGHLYSSADGSSWTRNATAFTYDIDPDQEIGFTDFATVQNTVTSVTVVGTESAGYYVVGADASETPTSPAVSGSNYRESDLSGLAVTTFYADTTLRTDYPVPTAAGDPYELLDGYLLFAGTANGGLWRALFHDGATQWVRE